MHTTHCDITIIIDLSGAHSRLLFTLRHNIIIENKEKYANLHRINTHTQTRARARNRVVYNNNNTKNNNNIFYEKR